MPIKIRYIIISTVLAVGFITPAPEVKAQTVSVQPIEIPQILSKNELIKPLEAPQLAEQAKLEQVSPPTPKAQQRASVSGNSYEPGQCVWFIKNMRPEIPNNWGSAHSWLANARSSGWATGSTPAVGAVGVKGNHVVLITAINGNTVTYTDMNGRYIPFEIATRTAPASNYMYIY